MPYDIRRNYGGCRGYAVVGGSGIHGCHTTRRSAVEQQRALYAAENAKKVSKQEEWEGKPLYDMLSEDEKAFADSLLKLAEEVLGKEETAKLKKGITGSNAEKSYARLENAISQELQKQGYDGVIFYDKTGSMVHPKQAFVFEKSKPTQPLKEEVKPVEKVVTVYE